MDLRTYLNLARRWLWLVLLCTLIAAGGAYYFASQQTPIYATSATVLLNASNQATPASSSYSELVLNERLTRTYIELLNRSETVQEVLGRYGSRPSILSISGSSRRDTSLIDIRVQSSDPEAAAFVANELPLILSRDQRERQRARYALTRDNLSAELARAEQAMLEGREELERLNRDDSANAATIATLSARLAQQERTAEGLRQNLFSLRLVEDDATDILSVIEPARVPSRPIRPQPMNNATTAALMGALLALGIAFLFEYLDDTIKPGTDLEGLLGLSVLGMIGRLANRSLLTEAPAHAGVGEAFRILRTNIRFALVDEPLHTLLVTSPAPGEGKSTTAANLAVVLAQAGHPTILVDADLRRPRQHSIFATPNREGLTTALVERDQPAEQYLQETSVEGLRLLTTGPVPPNPSELLGSHRMQEVLEELQALGDYVILDTSPVLAVADSSVLANYVSGIVLVLRAGSSRLDTTRRAVEQLQGVQGRILGALLNDVREEQGQYYYYYYQSQDKRPVTKGWGGRMRTMLLSLLPFRRG